MPDNWTLYSWRVRGNFAGLPKGEWYTLSWKMTEEKAKEWAIANQVELQKVAGSAELRRTKMSKPERGPAGGSSLPAVSSGSEPEVSPEASEAVSSFKCPVCGGRSYVDVGPPRKEDETSPLRYFACSSCNFAFTDPAISGPHRG